MIAKRYIHRKTLFLVSLCLLTSGFSNSATAGECKESVAQAVSIQGQVEVRSAGTGQWKAVQHDDELCAGDRLRVRANSRAGLYLNNDSFLRLGEQSSVNFNAPAEDDSTWLDLLEGVAHFISRVRHSFQVNTPYVNASIEGTEFVVTSDTDQASVSVIEGKVQAVNSQGEVLLGAGESVVAVRGNAPSKVLTVTPGDAVKWALYYPLVIDPYQTDWVADAASADSIRQAQTLYADGDLVAALKNLDGLPVEARSLEVLLYRAALLLSVGRVDEASKDIREALSQSQSDGRGLALQSIIALVGNDKEEALRLAQQATRQSAQTSASYAALSYAQQAAFDLDSALSSARRAVELAPRDALSRARVAELELAKGELRSAIESASMAVNLNPKLSRTHSVEGFAHLTQFNIAHAHAAFAQAIVLDQSDPLPRLGLGLAKIRKGRLEEGRHDIEIAASLDPNSAIIRSYLGKAYFEENRESLAATQLDMAKKLDPNDPTPWYYDALRKQTLNRPVEALEDIQTSIALNDNRAVYRSSFYLDQDEAARNASQARIYQDLGFNQLALTEGYKSLQTSPQSHSAHRLLSDSYTGLPRYESARLSELLQSQLMQPLNTTPIQPQLAASNLGILDGAGPSSGGFSEYTPLFTRNGFNVQLNAIAGSNDTRGNDLVISGLNDLISYSFGQYHYETDGWRDNNDLEQNIYDVFVQGSISPTTSIQLEYRYQEAESGDLGFRFDPDDFSPILRNDGDSRLGRLGIHHQPTPTSDLVASIIYQDLEQERTENDTQSDTFPTPLGPLPGTVDSTNEITRDSDALTAELQFIQHIDNHVFTLGAGLYNENRTITQFSRETLTIPLPIPPFVFTDSLAPPPISESVDPERKDVYLYSLLKLPFQMNMTLGASYADFESSNIEIDKFDPKIGLTWEAWQNIIFRATYLESLARPLNMDQTIEPTQVAGFNQLFDDVEGSEIQHYGIGFDANLSRTLSIGAEFYRRDLNVPLSTLGSEAVLEDRDEKHYQGYVYWTPVYNLGVRLSYENEQFERDLLLTPEDLKTQRLPVGLSYHWASGMYVQSVGTYVDQEITQFGVTEKENFWNVDATIGYRFPRQLGKAEIIVKNMLDKEFSYYDLSFQSREPLPPQFQPERQIFARFTLDF